MAVHASSSAQGEPGKVLAVNKGKCEIYLEAKRVGLGVVKKWYNYTELGKL